MAEMPEIDLSQRVFNMSTAAANDWASFGSDITFAVNARGELKRGINIQLGAALLTSLDAGLSKYLVAKLTASGQALAEITAQVQMPLNLFDEVGAAVRLDAIAEIAAGVEASLGISVGDILELVGQSSGMDGMPLKLFRILLEEAELSGSFYAKAAITAQAYAELAVTGTAIRDIQRGIEPGFNVVGGYGAGLEVGAGYRLGLRVGIADFPRLVGRSVDVIVDAVVDTGRGLLTDSSMVALLEASRAPSKIALRLAYEMGDFLVTQSPTQDVAGQRELTLRCGQVVLEEFQRFLLRSAVAYALDTIRGALGGGPANRWDAAQAERESLAEVLRELPSQPLDSSLAYWDDLIARTLQLATSLLGGADPSIQESAAVVWGALRLVHVADQRVAHAATTLSIIGLPTTRTHRSFEGPLADQPPQELDDLIRSALSVAGTPAGGALEASDLLSYLCGDSILNPIVALPGVGELLDAMIGPLGQSRSEIASALLSNVGAIVLRPDGSGDNDATLRAFADALGAFTHQQVEGQVAPALRDVLVGHADMKKALDEVVLPSLTFAVDTVFDQALHWAEGTITKENLSEALSGVLMRFLGRSLIVLTDVVMNAAAHEGTEVLRGLADHVGDDGGLLDAIMADDGVTLTRQDAAELLAEALQIGADLFGPLPDQTRFAIRSALYECVDSLPADADTSYLEQLGDDFFIPNQRSLERLAQELADVALDRFVAFVERLVVVLGAKVLEELLEFVAASAARVVEWMTDVLSGLAAIERRIAELIAQIAELAADVADQFAMAAQTVLDSFAILRNNAMRSKFKDALVDALYDDALGKLEDNGVYCNLVPSSTRAGVRSTMKSALRASADNKIVDDALASLGAAAASLDDFIDDVRDLDPNRPLAPQLRDLLLDAAEDLVRDALGGGSIRIPVAFDISWRYPEVYTDWSGVHTRWRTANKRIDLGHVPINTSKAIDLFRDAARGIDAFADAVDSAASDLANAFAQEFALTESETERLGLEGERRALGRWAEEAKPARRSVAILSPVASQVVDRPITAIIHIAGVSESIVESDDDTPARVLVFCNGEPLDVASFTVEPSIMPGVRLEAPSPRSPQPFTLTPHASARVSSPLMAAGPAAHRVEGALARTAGGGDRAVPRPSSNGTVTQNPTGLRSLGRPLGKTAADRVLGDSNGLTLKWPLAPADCEEGVNTLAVVVIDATGNRIERAVAFLAVRGAEPEDDGAPRLPSKEIDRRRVTPAERPAGASLTRSLDARRDLRAKLMRSVSERPDPLRRASRIAPGLTRNRGEAR